MIRRELVVEIPHPDFAGEDTIKRSLFQSGTHQDQEQQQLQDRHQGPPQMEHGFVYNLIVILLDVFDLGINGLRATINNYVEMILWTLWLGMKIYYAATSFLICHRKKITFAFVLSVVITHCSILIMICKEVFHVLSYLSTVVNNLNYYNEDDPTVTSCSIGDNLLYNFYIYNNNNTTVINKIKGFMMYFVSSIIGVGMFSGWTTAVLLEIKRQTLFPKRQIISTKRNGLNIVLFCFLFWKFVNNYCGSFETNNNNNNHNNDDSTNNTMMTMTIDYVGSMYYRYRVPFMMTLCTYIWCQIVLFVLRLVVLEFFKYDVNSDCERLLSLLKEEVDENEISKDELKGFIKMKVIEEQLDDYTKTTKFHIWTFRLVVFMSVFWEVAKTILVLSSFSDDDNPYDNNAADEPNYNTINDLAFVGMLTLGITSIILYLFESF